MKKTAITLLFAAFLSISALAQSVQEGMNHFYAQRYQSAKSTFEKLLASNPNNIEATYWLGQVMIEQKNLDGARSLYEKALMTNGNAPLLMVGMGSVELLDGKTAEARARFENAINTSKGRKGNDPAILNAVGRANVVAYSAKNKNGDLDYAIAKLTEAAKINGKNADIYLNLGDAYKKKGNMGGDAILAYRQALEINPSFAVAPYRAAMLYRTQQSSYQNPAAWTTVIEQLNQAIKADPNFAPAYVELYNYNLFGKSDFAAAEAFAKLYESSADPSPDNAYLRVQTDIFQKKYSNAITTLKDILTKTNNNPRPVVFRALAVATMGAK
ncbi:MAG TPA: tetratricopeptide repeat protein, partial [Flavisolibacter sp.]